MKGSGGDTYVRVTVDESVFVISSVLVLVTLFVTVFVMV
jgi:hypothetical protein